MFFWTQKNETPLIEAILADDVEAVKASKGVKEHLYAQNYLGYNALEIARYLGKEECQKILFPPEERKFRAMAKGSANVESIGSQEFEALFSCKYLSHLKFYDYDLFKKAIKRCPRIFRRNLDVELIQALARKGKVISDMELQKKEETPEHFHARFLKFKKELNSGYVAETSIRWIDDILEYGLFAERPFKKGEYIAEFTGVVHSVTVTETPYQTYCLKYPARWTAFSNITVDAKWQGNETRFANHSYNPNMTPKLCIEKTLLHTVFFANRDIAAGEQLTWNYGEQYWRHRPPPLDI